MAEYRTQNIERTKYRKTEYRSGKISKDGISNWQIIESNISKLKNIEMKTDRAKYCSDKISQCQNIKGKTSKGQNSGNKICNTLITNITMSNAEIYLQNYLSLQIWLVTNITMSNTEISFSKIICPRNSDFKLSDGCLYRLERYTYSSRSYIQSALCLFCHPTCRSPRSSIMCLSGTIHFHKTTPLQDQGVVL